ncbi:hypothetical protein LOK46_13925 [Methylobacterium sp. NMS14P]|uniref:hypothetical protein n=1 Tax=Methylobacterium sp. NMS14P TaxID=2894310 RepID=UPI002358E012|nr:hypothetical protein [Methylobacterium sp. NMS14P]WCS27872.1 hypothetical protein LOK46_13925 [Methylobacterium sp. NMS14P]
MHSMKHVAEVVTLAACAAAVAISGQILLMPQVSAWQDELVTVLTRELPRS